MDSVEITRKQPAAQPATDGTHRPRRRIAKQILERGQRLRNRAGVLIGMSMGVVALLTVME